MNRFDRLKIVAPLKFVRNFSNRFLTISNEHGITIKKKYSQKFPCQLYIEADYVSEQTVIEFSGKILGKEYPQLINKNTISDCLAYMHNHGICDMDIEGILRYAYVLSLDVTIDAHCPTTWKNLTPHIMTAVRNNSHNLCRRYANGNVEISQNIKNRKRLVIYDKEREMGKAENKRFLKTLDATDALAVHNYYKGTIRFEFRIMNKQLILRELNISDNTLMRVLHSEGTPIQNFLDDVLMPVAYYEQRNGLSALKNECLLKCYDYDMTRVEWALRNACGAQFHKPLEQLRQLAMQHSHTNVKKVLLIMVHNAYPEDEYDGEQIRLL